ncbi:hypothetical protein SAMN02910339_01334 [Lachnospiraceae bacterium YSD2013]|nr:hypothetical protein SAMN02910339_01334 [Lachnospiraceae bacterium YSD2013]
MAIKDFKEDGLMMKKELIKRLFENETPYVVKDGDKYDVYANNLHFTCCYSDEEVEKMADLCLELLEELRRINEAGYTRADLMKAKENAKEEKGSIVEYFAVYESFKNEKIEAITDELAKTARVGGTFYSVIARPVFVSGILSVFGVVIDNFSDENLYFSALFMLIRVAMHMHGEEISD